MDENDRRVLMTIEHVTDPAPPPVRLSEARRLVEGTEDSFDVVSRDTNGHLDLKATYDAANTPGSPLAAESGS